MKIKLLTLAVILLVSLQVSINAQTGQLSGSVLQSAGKPLSGVHVTLRELSAGTSTDADGNFSFRGIPAGTYTVVTSHIGYKPVMMEVVIRSGETRKINFNLEIAPLRMGEVTVTSSRYERIAKEIPLPIEVVEEHEIRSKAAISVPDAVAEEPGLALTRDGIWATGISIRGMTGTSIVTLVDGNRLETATEILAGLSLIDLNNVERIEVVKGAASSLYGTGALGGVINIISKYPGYSSHLRFGGTLSSSYRTVNEGAVGNASFFVTDQQWYFRLNGTMRSATDTKTPAGTLANSRFRDHSYSADFGFRFADDHEIRLRGQRFYGEDIGIPGGDAFAATAIARYPTEERNMISAEYRWSNISDVLLNTSVKVYHHYIYRNVEMLPNPANPNLKLFPRADHRTNGAVWQSYWNPGGSHLIVAGVDFWQRSLDSRRERYFVARDSIRGERPVPMSHYRSLGFFAQDEFRLLPDLLTVTLGGRVDQISVKNDDAFDPEYTIVKGVYNPKPKNQKQLWSATEEDDVSYSGNLGLLFQPVKNLNITVAAAHSFRSASLEERYQFIDLGSQVRLGDPALDPEKGWFFDLGVRYFGEIFSVSANTFYNTLSSLIIEKPGTFQGRKALIKTNVGSAKLYGYDFRLEVNPVADLVCYATAAYVRGEDTEAHLNLPNISPLFGKIGVRSGLFGYGTLDLSATVFDTQDNLAPGESRTPGYAFIDVYASSPEFALGFVRFSVHAGVENLFDREYKNHLSSNRGLIRAEPGRNFFLKLNTAF